jgi:transcriptional regulator with XRE-family HTH domain
MQRKYSYVGVLEVLGMFRGLQQRVAKKVGVDAAFVSRVARGERSSEKVMAALMEELDAIRDYLNRMPEHQD